MRKRDLKKMISDAYREETPDLRCSIISACQAEQADQSGSRDARKVFRLEHRPSFGGVFKRGAAIAACLAVFALGAFLGAMFRNGGAVGCGAETFVYLDVNPGVELHIDGEDRVVECIAGNEDAVTVLSGLELEGVDMNTALTAIVGSMYVNGYLTENSNSVLISVDTKAGDENASFFNDIMKKINAVFEKAAVECSIIAQRVTVDEDLKQRAQENGVSVGKMHLLEKMVDGAGAFSENAIKRLSSLSIRDLSLMYLQETSGDPEPMEDIVYGTVKLAVSSEEATNAVIAEMGKTLDDVECYRTFFLPSRNGESKVVYAVVLMLYDDPSVYKYEVDCQSGEVVRIDENP